MLDSRTISAGVAVLATLVVLLAAAAAASAAPIAVNLRVEGSSTTLYEGPVTTSAETFQTVSSAGAHPCDFSSNGASESEFPDGGSPAATPTTALHDAALASGLPFDAKWFGNEEHGGEPGDFFVTQVSSDVNGGPPTFPSWGYAVNYTTATVGGCQIALAPGNEVLWAYDYFNLVHLLSLTGPASASAGTPFTVHVADGRTGEPIAGSSIGTFAAGATTPLASAAVTDASGNATVSLPAPGPVALKATQPESVRSNALAVCVHAGNDGTCGSSVAVKSVPAGGPPAPNGAAPATAVIARILGVKSGHVYSRRSAPRVLRGVVSVAARGTLRAVRIRLQRRVGRRCLNFSGARGEFVRSPKCAPAAFFSIGASESFSYLLPSRLPVGRYVYDIDAIEASGHVTSLAGGVSHVVFRVR